MVRIEMAMQLEDAMKLADSLVAQIVQAKVGLQDTTADDENAESE